MRESRKYMKKGVFKMAKINGIYYALHEQIGRFVYPYYKGGLEFRETVSLADAVKKNGSNDTSETYDIMGLVAEKDAETVKAKKGAFEKRFENIFPSKPLLLTESNSAHHLTYFYVKEIAKQLKKSGDHKLLVINFDQHEDYGSTGAEFFCGSWGSRIVADIPCDYIAVGVGEKGKISSWKHDVSGVSKVEFLPEEPGESPADRLAKILSERHGDCEKIYVTVDMDVLTCSGTLKRTNWGSGKLTMSELKDCLEILPEDKMVAADITGFPPVDRTKLDEQLDLLNSYTENIKETAEVLCRKLGIPLLVE